MSSAALDDGHQHVVGGVEVVVDGVALVQRRLHRIGRGALLGEVDDGVRLRTRAAASAGGDSSRRRRRGGSAISRPITSRQASSRSPIGRIGVRHSTSSSLSMFRRDRLSTIATSWPRADRCSAVGQPQNPSPPRMMTRMIASRRVVSAGASLGPAIAPHNRSHCCRIRSGRRAATQRLMEAELGPLARAAQVIRSLSIQASSSVIDPAFSWMNASRSRGRRPIGSSTSWAVGLPSTSRLLTWSSWRSAEPPGR